MSDFFRQHATGRNVLISLAVVFVLAALSQLVLVPAYRTVGGGFVPLDLQYPLTREMIAIQRGAFRPGVHEAYMRFGTLEVLFIFANAMFTMLFWSWLATRAPQTFAEPALRRGLLLIPILGAAAGIVQILIFANLVFANVHEPLLDATQAAIAIHRARYLLNNVANAVTVGFVALALIVSVMRRGRIA